MENKLYLRWLGEWGLGQLYQVNADLILERMLTIHCRWERKVLCGQGDDVCRDRKSGVTNGTRQTVKPVDLEANDFISRNVQWDKRGMVPLRFLYLIRDWFLSKGDKLGTL